jgi:predicted transcriptional regulator
LIRRRRLMALSQGDLAIRAGMSRAAIVRIEGGHANARPSTIRRIASALACEPVDLMAVMQDHRLRGSPPTQSISLNAPT